jgi:hypothetical protein
MEYVKKMVVNQLVLIVLKTPRLPRYYNRVVKKR